MIAANGLIIITIFHGIYGRGPHHPAASGHHGHSHPQPHQSTILTQAKAVLQDIEHMKEDVGDWIADTDEPISDDEWEFRYFKIHDYDKNRLLDGQELFQAVLHSMDEDMVHVDLPTDQKEKFISKIIDDVLENDDKNNDGYLSYKEFSAGKKRVDEEEKRIQLKRKLAKQNTVPVG